MVSSNRFGVSRLLQLLAVAIALACSASADAALIWLSQNVTAYSKAHYQPRYVPPGSSATPWDDNRFYSAPDFGRHQLGDFESSVGANAIMFRGRVVSYWQAGISLEQTYYNGMKANVQFRLTEAVPYSLTSFGDFVFTCSFNLSRDGQKLPLDLSYAKTLTGTLLPGDYALSSAASMGLTQGYSEATDFRLDFSMDVPLSAVSYASVPEPSALSIAALGALVLLRHRR